MFIDREEAGTRLAQAVALKRWGASLVAGLARGGVEVAHPVAQMLGIPLRALAVKKIPSPFNAEYAIGAVAPGGLVYFDERVMKQFTQDDAAAAVRESIRSLKARVNMLQKLYDPTFGSHVVKGTRIILVDDGAATGETFFAAAGWLRKHGVGSIFAAIPVAHPSLREDIASRCDGSILLETPYDFQAVGQHYRDFPQCRDERVIELVRGSAAMSGGGDTL